MLTDFEQIRGISGWDRTLTSRSRAYPDGEWRRKHVEKGYVRVLRKAQVKQKHAKPMAARLCEYLVMNVAKMEENFATSDLGYWKEKLRKYAVAETDKARESGFVA